jgi:hypothetical protein
MKIILLVKKVEMFKIKPKIQLKMHPNNLGFKKNLLKIPILFNNNKNSS